MYTKEELIEYFKEDLFATKVTGINIIEANNDYAKCSFEITDNHMNAKGIVMGGAIYTLADFTFAIATNQHKDYYTLSTNASINYLRPGSGIYLYAEAIKIKDGKTVCFYEINVYNDENVLISKVMITGTHVYKQN